MIDYAARERQRNSSNKRAIAKEKRLGELFPSSLSFFFVGILAVPLIVRDEEQRRPLAGK